MDRFADTMTFGIRYRQRSTAFSQNLGLLILTNCARAALCWSWGPQVIPRLSEGLKDLTQSFEKQVHTRSGSFRQQGKDIRRAIPALVEDLSDPAVEVRDSSSLGACDERPFGR